MHKVGAQPGLRYLPLLWPRILKLGAQSWVLGQQCSAGPFFDTSIIRIKSRFLTVDLRKLLFVLIRLGLASGQGEIGPSSERVSVTAVHLRKERQGLTAGTVKQI